MCGQYVPCSKALRVRCGESSLMPGISKWPKKKKLNFLDERRKEKTRRRVGRRGSIDENKGETVPRIAYPKRWHKEPDKSGQQEVRHCRLRRRNRQLRSTGAVPLGRRGLWCLMHRTMRGRRFGAGIRVRHERTVHTWSDSDEQGCSKQWRATSGDGTLP